MRCLQARQNLCHALARRQLLELDMMTAVQRGTTYHIAEGQQQFAQIDLRMGAAEADFRWLRTGRKHVALEARQGIDVLGRLLELFVLLQAPDQARARIELLIQPAFLARQQHA